MSSPGILEYVQRHMLAKFPNNEYRGREAKRTDPYGPQDMATYVMQSLLVFRHRLHIQGAILLRISNSDGLYSKVSSKRFLLTVPRWYFFCGSFMLFLSFFCGSFMLCVCYAFVRVCVLLLCGHLL